MWLKCEEVVTIFNSKAKKGISNELKRKQQRIFFFGKQERFKHVFRKGKGLIDRS